MKKLVVLTLVLTVASGAHAALTLVDVPTDPINIGDSIAILVNNSADGAYSGWLQMVMLRQQTILSLKRQRSILKGDSAFSTR